MCFHVFICRARPSFTASLLSFLSLELFANFLSKLCLQQLGLNQTSKLFVECKMHFKTWC